MKISEIIERVKAYHPPLDRVSTTDVVKYGDPEKECTGIGVTCFPSTEVICRARDMGINLLIVHEPLFFAHKDSLETFAGDPTFEAKKQLLEETGIVVWRDHDHIHGGPPMKEGKPYMDGIFYGIMKELGWENYLHKYEHMPLMYHIPETTGRELAELLIEKCGLNGLRVVGDLDTKVKNVFFCEHVQGRDGDTELIKITEEEEIDALIPLEIVDWTMTAYVRDSTALGRPRVILEMGHFNFEELGMRHMIRYLPELVGEDIPVHFLPSADGFDYLKR